MEISAAGEPTASVLSGRLKIPIRNLWLLMLYASDLFRHLEAKKVQWEDSPDDLPDLIAEILSRIVERRLKKQLGLGYRPVQETLSRIRGRIDWLKTECRQTMSRGKVVCRFGQLTIDTDRNRLARAALIKLGHSVGRRDLAQRCRSLASALERLGVSKTLPDRQLISVAHFGRCEESEQIMVAASKLAITLGLPTEERGGTTFYAPDRDIIWLRKLYEKAIAGFYAVVLSPEDWMVSAGRTMDWNAESGTEGVWNILPSMRTDIILESVSQGRRKVIDTKFSSILASGWYREESLKSAHLYQIYAYLRSQEKAGDIMCNSAEGLLLYPAVGRNVDEEVRVHGHTLRFATVDLSVSGKEIRERLLNVVK